MVQPSLGEIASSKRRVLSNVCFHPAWSLSAGIRIDVRWQAPCHARHFAFLLQFFFVRQFWIISYKEMSRHIMKRHIIKCAGRQAKYLQTLQFCHILIHLETAPEGFVVLRPCKVTPQICPVSMSKIQWLHLPQAFAWTLFFNQASLQLGKEPEKEVILFDGKQLAKTVQSVIAYMVYLWQIAVAV